MTPQQFLMEFGPIASAPNGVQKLREMVLQLAVMGKLTEHLPADEDIDVQIEKAQSERKTYLEEVDGRASKGDGFISLTETPYQIQSHWRWMALGNLSRYIQRGKGPKYADKGRIRVVSQKCVQWSGFELEPARWIDDQSINAYGSERFLQQEDLLWNSTGTGTAGRIAIYPGIKDVRAVADSHVTVIRLTAAILSRYLWCVVASPGIQERVNPSHDRSIVSGTTNQVELSTTSVRTLPVPLPPLAEQKRIVAKVDELMALCDRLEALQNQRKSQRSVLTKELLGRLAQGDADDVQKCLQNLSHLVTDADQVPEIRKAILSLAVQGRLVEMEQRFGDSKICEHFDLVNGYAFKSEWFVRSGVRLCRNVNVAHGELDWSEHVCVSSEVANEYSKFSLCAGDVLLSLDRPIISTGLKYARVSETDLPCLLLQRVAKIVPKHDQVDMDYLVIWLRSSFFVDVIDPGRSNGVPHISTKQVSQMGILLPGLKEQKHIVAKVDQLMALCDTLEAKLRKASEVQEQLAASAIAALTGIQTQEKETMKAPKTELVARLKLGKKPSTKDHAPLASLLVRHNNELSPNSLFQHSSLDIDGFYRQLKIEMNHGWIVQPEVPSMKVEERR